VQGNSITLDFGFPSVVIKGQTKRACTLVIRVREKEKQRPCPRCGRLTARIHPYHRQYKQICSLGTYRVVLELVKAALSLPPVQQGVHRTGRGVRVAAAQPAAVSGLSGPRGPAADSACAQGRERVIETLVRRAFRTEAHAPLAGRQLRPSNRLALDEFTVRKGHHYRTVLCDLERRYAPEVISGHGLTGTQH